MRGPYSVRELERGGGFVLLRDGNTLEPLEVEAERLNLAHRIASALERLAPVDRRREELPASCMRILALLSTVPQKTRELAERLTLSDEATYAGLRRLEGAGLAARAGLIDRAMTWVKAPTVGALLDAGSSAP